jgi:hypothetical protein
LTWQLTAQLGLNGTTGITTPVERETTLSLSFWKIKPLGLTLATANVTSLQSANGHALAFNTDGTTERMRIDSAGRVTMPYQPNVRCDGSDYFSGFLIG